MPENSAELGFGLVAIPRRHMIADRPYRLVLVVSALSAFSWFIGNSFEGYN